MPNSVSKYEEKLMSSTTKKESLNNFQLSMSEEGQISSRLSKNPYDLANGAVSQINTNNTMSGNTNQNLKINKTPLNLETKGVRSM